MAFAIGELARLDHGLDHGLDRTSAGRPAAVRRVTARRRGVTYWHAVVDSVVDGVTSASNATPGQARMAAYHRTDSTVKMLQARRYDGRPDAGAAALRQRAYM